MSKSVRLLRDLVLILLGSAAGLYAVLQAINLNNLSQSGGRSVDPSYAAGSSIGSVVGLVLGGVLCLVFFWIAFRRRPKSATRKGEAVSRAKEDSAGGRPGPEGIR